MKILQKLKNAPETIKDTRFFSRYKVIYWTISDTSQIPKYFANTKPSISDTKMATLIKSLMTKRGSPTKIYFI